MVLLYRTCIVPIHPCAYSRCSGAKLKEDWYIILPQAMGNASKARVEMLEWA